MMSRTASTLAVLLAASMLSGCSSTFDTVSDWFDRSKKVKIQGERISIIASEQQLSTDPMLANVKMDLPAPKRNMEWPQPGGTPDNVMGNLMADGPLAQVWSAEAGKGTDDDSRLTAPPIVAGGLVYVLDANTHVFAFDAKTGQRRGMRGWRRRGRSAPHPGSIFLAPATTSTRRRVLAAASHTMTESSTRQPASPWCPRSMQRPASRSGPPARPFRYARRLSWWTGGSM
jgi:hypothetical protein